MNKAHLMLKFTDLLASYTNALLPARIEDKIRKDLSDFVEDILTQLQEAHNRIPHKNPKTWDVKRKFSIELNLTVKADLNRGDPGSYYEPHEPASIEDIELEIEGCPITYTLWDALMKNYEDEIEEMVWDAAEEIANEEAQARAEYMRDSKENR